MEGTLAVEDTADVPLAVNSLTAGVEGTLAEGREQEELWCMHRKIMPLILVKSFYKSNKQHTYLYDHNFYTNLRINYAVLHFLLGTYIYLLSFNSHCTQNGGRWLSKARS